jgi:hypothetical protein
VAISCMTCLCGLIHTPAAVICFASCWRLLLARASDMIHKQLLVHGRHRLVLNHGASGHDCFHCFVLIFPKEKLWQSHCIHAEPGPQQPKFKCKTHPH